jgi:SAM-dependent methyltransferase
MGSHELTDTIFWDQYWKNLSLPVEIDTDFSADRCLAKELRNALDGLDFTGAVLEIGAAPGKWLAFMNYSYGTTASAIEYSPVGAEALKNNLDLLSIPVDRVFIGDFFTIEPEPKFEAVMSFGFIEHFDDPASVVSRHLSWLAPGGKLIIGIPNFANFHGNIQKVLDKGVYDAHNIGIMNRDSLASLVDKRMAHVDSVNYLGSFEPALPYWTRQDVRGLIQAKVLFARLLLRTLKILRHPKIFDRFNNRYVSSYLLLVATKS